MNKVPEIASTGAYTPEFLGRLSYYRTLIQPFLEKPLVGREPTRHLYDLIRSLLARSGKGLRPALCLATVGAFGADIQKAYPSAAALEMLHNAFLVHDDIEDESEERRGQPTLYREYGIALALNVGDAMQAISVLMLRDNLSLLGVTMATSVFEEFNHMIVESFEGQATELGWIRDNNCRVSDDDYLLLVLKKTCWYSFIHPCRIGAIVAGCSKDDLERFDKFGYLIGAAFQIQDDILNLTGDKASYGKEIGGDLAEGKRTLILAHLFKRLRGAELNNLQEVFAKPRSGRSLQDIDWIRTLLERHGSIDYARAAARSLADRAAAEFPKTFSDAADGPDKAFIEQLVSYVVQREV